MSCRVCALSEYHDRLNKSIKVTTGNESFEDDSNLGLVYTMEIDLDNKSSTEDW